MPFACIFVPNFPVEAVLRAEPELRSHAVAVLGGKPPLQKILAVNEEARAKGVLPGMTQLQVEGCAEVTLRNRSEVQESAAHQALLDCAQSFSPRVEDAAPDTLLLDLSGLTSLFGPLSKIAREISHRAMQMGLRANVAVASTLEAALLAAQGFSGVTVLPEGKESEVLGSLPIEVLFAEAEKVNAANNTSKKESDFSVPESALGETEGCLRGENVQETLHRWGVHKFRDLAALPEIELSERLGQYGLELQRRARGISARALVPCEPPLMFEEAMELEYPLVLLEPLAFLLSRMLEQLCGRLQGRALAAQELHLELTLENGRSTENSKEGPQEGSVPPPSSPVVPHLSPVAPLSPVPPPLSRSLRQGGKGNIFHRAIHLPIPLLDSRLFLKLLQLDLKAHPPGAPIVKVHLRIEPAKPRPGQEGLFIPSSPQPEKLELTLARISAVVGEGRAGSPALLDTHRPQAFEMRHFTPSESRLRGAARLARPERNLAHFAASNHSVLDRSAANLVTALRIFRPPVLVTVNQCNGKPSHISSRRQKITSEVLWSAGPWRTSGDWWEEDAWIRDEWDIAVQEKNGIALYRLVHDLVGGGWMLEGSYD